MQRKGRGYFSKFYDIFCRIFFAFANCLTSVRLDLSQFRSLQIHFLSLSTAHFSIDFVSFTMYSSTLT